MTHDQEVTVFLDALIKCNGSINQALEYANERGCNGASEPQQDAWFEALDKYRANFGDDE